MCGRTACTLNPDQLSRATRYRNSKGRDVEPRWKDGDQNKYRTSYNKAPMSYCPILLHSRHLQDATTPDGSVEDEERMIVSMKWGLIPSWVKDVKSAQYKMNNARSDSILTKASYKRPLEKGQRCVVLADGFYEWNTTKSEKQPYFIFFKDSDPANENTETRPVTMAGIFERRKTEDEDDLFSFSIITVDAHPEFSWLHHRMPAMLENDDVVRQWLDSGKIPLKEAVELIKPKSCLAWYPVSKLVNNSRNNSPECMEKIDLEKVKHKQSSESKGMAKWLSKAAQTPSKTTAVVHKNEAKHSPVKVENSHCTAGKRKQKPTGMETWLKKGKKRVKCYSFGYKIIGASSG